MDIFNTFQQGNHTGKFYDSQEKDIFLSIHKKLEDMQKSNSLVWYFMDGLVILIIYCNSKIHGN